MKPITMRTNAMLGAMAVLFSASAGCIAPAPEAEAPPKPAAVARATSSAITKKMSGVSQWRVYESPTSLVVLGFGKDKKPMNGLRLRFASAKQRKWAVSLETVKGRGALQIDKDGKVVRNTMTDEEVGVMFGATRVLEAWRKKSGASTTGTRSVAFADTADGTLTCLKAGREVLKDCGPVVAKCAGAAGRAAMRAGRLGAQAGAIVGGVVLGKCAWQNRKAVYDCGKSAYDNGKDCYEKLTEKDKSEEEKNPPPEDKDKDKESEDAGAHEEPTEDAGTPEEPTEDAGTPEAEDPDGGVPVASADEDQESQDSPEEQQEDAEAAEQDPENAPAEEDVAEEESPTSDDEVDPDPPVAEEEEQEAEEPVAEEEPEAPSDEGALVSSFGIGLGRLGTRAVASRSGTRSGACGKTRTLVCGARKSSSFCRCVR